MVDGNPDNSPNNLDNDPLKSDFETARGTIALFELINWKIHIKLSFKKNCSNIRLNLTGKHSCIGIFYLRGM